MTKRTAFACIAVVAVAAALLAQQQGCGETTYFFNSSAIIRGEVSSVTLAAAGIHRSPVRRASPGGRGWLAALGLSRAFAQGDCAASGGGVLACTRMTDESEGHCVRVDRDDCGFFKRVRVPSGRSSTIEFVQDQNGNGSADDVEPLAVPAAPLPFAICNGDRIRLTGVSIDFTPTGSGNGEWTADAFVKQIDACPESQTNSSEGPE